MKWNVSFAGRSITVDLPDIIADGQTILAKVDGAQVHLVWHKSQQSFSLVDEQGVERQVHIRQRQLSRFEGESDARLTSELYVGGYPGMHYAQLSVEPHVPGQNGRKTQKTTKGQLVRSQITGKILKVFVKVGDHIEAGQALLVIEAMKMENRIFAQTAGVVQTVTVKEGDAVATGRELIRIG